MTYATASKIHLGYEVGIGEPVSIPLAHTFVTGQTQLSGKTTTLQAIVVRSGKRALAFVTKRGEQLDGRVIRPYLPREGDRPIHWRLVETILASALGQRNMKYERFWIVSAAKGAKSLDGVRSNVRRLQAKAKGNTAETYELIGEYLDLVLPEMRELNAADTLPLLPGLNVINIAGHSPQLQAMVIRACLEHVNLHESDVLTVFPEAWEFAPRGRITPASTEAVAMARKGAVLGNFLLCDSQDIAGVDTVVRQAASVWILGVQRELNELKRTLASIPANVTKPKPAEAATLELGQFFVCYGRHVFKTYVQPAWMEADQARSIAQGSSSIPSRPYQLETKVESEDEAVSPKEAEALREENAELRQRIAELEEKLADLHPAQRTAVVVKPTRPAAAESNGHVDENSLYQSILARLLKEPAILKLRTTRSEIRVEESVEMIDADGKTLRGRVALLITKGFFDEPTTASAAFTELQRTGFSTTKPNVYKECDKLAELGFLTKEKEGYRSVQGMKVNVVKR